MAICQDIGYKEPPNKVGITIEMLIDGALSGNIVEYVRGRTGCAKQTVTNSLKSAFPDRVSLRDRSLVSFLLGKWDLKHCSCCNTTKEIEEFYYNSSKSTGRSDLCKECNKQARRDSYTKDPSKEIMANEIRKKRLKEFQVPKWADLNKIKEIYLKCPEGFHVDHIIPLNGEFVSGLHVENNLQYLTIAENLSKNNTYHV